VKDLGNEWEITIATIITFASQILHNAQDDKVQNDKKLKVNQEKGK
jgi:hypothetical protein